MAFMLYAIPKYCLEKKKKTPLMKSLTIQSMEISWHQSTLSHLNITILLVL